MNIRLIIFSLTILFCATVYAQNGDTPTRYVYPSKSYRYRVAFTDKNECGFSTKRPERFLSSQSIERRKRYGLKVDEYDLPLTPAYLKAVSALGTRLHVVSKWNNTAVFELSDTTLLGRITALPFVKSVRRVWESPDSILIEEDHQPRTSVVTNQRDTLQDHYGHSVDQVRMLQVDSLHRAGWRGKGVTIAVVDGGFHNADVIEGLKGVKILGTRNFVRPERSVYEELSHGMMVLSCIAANTPGSFVGTAPEASFYLLQSEDDESEQLVEEDNWCAALEYADSLGCDIVTSSLGYYAFDHAEMSHRYAELDGQTAINSRSASLASTRGLLLLNSAGNAGDESWKKIGFPADALNILTVGAVKADGENTIFSSIGNTSDGRIKPDVMAMGQAAAVYNIDGSIIFVNGTSFSTPIMAGAMACLLQAFPNEKPERLIKAVQSAGNNAATPDNIYGYGIPSLVKAFDFLKK